MGHHSPHVQKVINLFVCITSHCIDRLQTSKDFLQLMTDVPPGNRNGMGSAMTTAPASGYPISQRTYVQCPSVAQFSTSRAGMCPTGVRSPLAAQRGRSNNDPQISTMHWTECADVVQTCTLYYYHKSGAEFAMWPWSDDQYLSPARLSARLHPRGSLPDTRECTSGNTQHDLATATETTS